MPFKLSKTTPANLPWGKSVRFNGVNQYLSVGAASNWTFLHNGSSWTAECWFNVPSASLGNRYTIISTNAASANIGMSLDLNDFLAGDVVFFVYKGVSGQWPVSVVTSGSIFTPNTWNHIAAVYNSGTSTGTIYMNGVAVASSGATSAFSTSAPTYTLAVGRYQFTTPAGYLNGYISNLRIANSVLYTASFTPPTSPLDVVTNTTLLACHDTSFKDGSVNNFAITTVGTPSISTVTPFAISTKSVLFNGSNQYLKLPSNSSAWTLNGNFTIECWFNTSTTNQNGIFTMNWNGDWNTVYGNGFSLSSNVVVTPQGNTTWTSPSINVWHHIAVVRSGSTITTYLDGVSVGSQTNSNQFGNASTTPGVGLFDTQSGVRAPFLGYISNLRILKGTALYTASFTALAEPLTSVASCSLLTCNADTIVDSSTNNFTITNNGSATVSSVVPFNVVSYGYKFNNRNNTAINKFNFKQAARAAVSGTQKAIFGYGFNGSNLSMTNLVSNTGVVATDTTGVGTARHSLAAAGYGTDKAIFGYGIITGGGTPNQSITNLVSNVGVVATDTTGVGTARYALAASGYGNDKAIFGYGTTGTNISITNLVSNTGVVANDVAGVGTARQYLAAAGYGNDKAIFGYGLISSNPGVSMTNLVSNTGVVSTDTTGVGSARFRLGASGYGTDKAIFGYGANGSTVSMTNKVSNTGIVATDTSGVGTARESVASAYGTDKSIFGYGYSTTFVSMTNLVSNTGVVATDTTGVGTARSANAAAGFSLT
jgi:hypothetical protein